MPQTVIIDRPDLYKTQMCYDYRRTFKCVKGVNCPFYHAMEEQRLAQLPIEQYLKAQSERYPNITFQVRQAQRTVIIENPELYKTRFCQKFD